MNNIKYDRRVLLDFCPNVGPTTPHPLWGQVDLKLHMLGPLYFAGPIFFSSPTFYQYNLFRYYWYPRKIVTNFNTWSWILPFYIISPKSLQKFKSYFFIVYFVTWSRFIIFSVMLIFLIPLSMLYRNSWISTYRIFVTKKWDSPFQIDYLCSCTKAPGIDHLYVKWVRGHPKRTSKGGGGGGSKAGKIIPSFAWALISKDELFPNMFWQHKIWLTYKIKI